MAQKEGGGRNWLRKQGEGRFTPLFLPPPKTLGFSVSVSVGVSLVFRSLFCTVLRFLIYSIAPLRYCFLFAFNASFQTPVCVCTIATSREGQNCRPPDPFLKSRLIVFPLLILEDHFLYIFKLYS